MESLKQDIIDCIQHSGDVTFAELHDTLGDRIDGEYTMFTSPDSNIVLWDDVTNEFIEAIGQLLAEGKIAVKYDQNAHHAYASLSVALPYPLVKQPLKNRYDAPHWLPVVMRLNPD